MQTETEKQLELPEWAWEYVIPDAKIGDAYEAMPASKRSVLKKTVARLHSILSIMAKKATHSVSCNNRFGYTVETTPAPFTLIFLPESYAYPQCFLATLLPAILSSSSLILPCFLPAEPVVNPTLSHEHPFIALREESTGLNPDLLTAIDLVGVEYVLSIDIERAILLLENFSSLAVGGRVIVLGNILHKEKLLLRSAQLAVTQTILPDIPSYTPYSQKNSSSSAPNSLFLDNSHEDVWVWPQLDSQWFCNRSVSLYSC